jgi:hypothetical protein
VQLGTSKAGLVQWAYRLQYIRGVSRRGPIEEEEEEEEEEQEQEKRRRTPKLEQIKKIPIFEKLMDIKENLNKTLTL